jgi:alpha-tubulin suppressor-like RCC1 family protein
VPTAIIGGYTWQTLVAGKNHTCGLTTTGAIYCWGSDAYGQLGDGAGGGLFSDKPSPVLVTGGYTFVALAGGIAHDCGLTSTGSTVCWGQNLMGELGSGMVDVSADAHDTPAPVTGGLTFVSLVGGFSHTCGFVAGGAMYCWGENGSEELGDAVKAHPTPVAVGGALRFTSVSVGHWHLCGVVASGTGYCWGSNAIYQLGDGTNTSRPNPAPVSGGLVFRSIAAGYSHTCGVTTSSAAYCWGVNNGQQLGDGTTTTRTTPTPVHAP